MALGLFAFSLSFVLVCLLLKLRNLDRYLVMLKVCQGSMRCNCGEMPHRKDEDSGESSGDIHALGRIGGSRPVFSAFSLFLSMFNLMFLFFGFVIFGF